VRDEKDRILDFNGLRTGAPMTKGNLITIITAIVLFFVLRALPLSAWGEFTSTALGLLVATITLLVGLRISFVVPVVFAAVAGVFLHLWDFDVVRHTIGFSTFPMMLGMIIVAMGCEYTPFGQRISFILLRVFGQKPIALVVAIGTFTIILSAFVSNNAVIIMMSSICAGMLVQMKQVPGSSKLGKAIMILVAACSMIGGGILITGSPIGNGTGISMLNTATGGLADISFGDWAKIGLPAFIILAIPVGLIYTKWFGVKNKDYTEIPPASYYQES
jgi:di/tricarboxylate transporter